MGEKIDQEITFINDVRTLMNKVKDNADYYYTDLIEMLNDLYLIALDKQFTNQIHSNKNINSQSIHQDIINLFDLHE